MGTGARGSGTRPASSGGSPPTKRTSRTRSSSEDFGRPTRSPAASDPYPGPHSQGTLMKETQDAPLRAQLKKLLGWEDAHVGFEAALEGVGPAHQGKTPPGLPFSPWQLLEHLRITQFDILDFCRNSAYKERAWPKDYWPPAPGPPSPSAWKESVAAFQRDRAALQKLAEDPSLDLFARIPHGSGQTYLRELLLVADHNAYHVGQLVLARRGLSIGPERVSEARNEGMKIHPFGDTAAVTGWLVVRGSGPSGPFHRRYRFTDTWARVDGAWQLVAAHDYVAPSGGR